jgi:hypothetical protein
MSEEDIDAKIDRMLDAARGGKTPHQLLLEASQNEAAKVDERAAAAQKNRERALKLLAEIEKTLGQ